MVISITAEKFYNDGLKKYFILCKDKVIRLYFSKEKEVLLSYIKHINLTRITFHLSLHDGKYYLEGFTVN